MNFTKSDDSDPVQLFRRLAVGTWHPLIDGYPTGIEDDDGKEGGGMERETEIFLIGFGISEEVPIICRRIC